MTSERSHQDAAYVENEVRQHDPDRYLTGMFATVSERPALWALYAFNAELARVRETVSEPMLGEIRLQWWRDAVQAMTSRGAVPHQPVAQALAVQVRAGRIDGGELQSLIDARQPELYDEPPADWEAFTAAHRALDGRLNAIAATLLGAGEIEVEAARSIGQAFGMTVSLKRTPALAYANRLALPQDRLDAHSPALKAFHTPGGSDAQRALMGELAEGVRLELDHAATLLRAARPKALSPLLLGRLAQSDLKVMLRSKFDPAVEFRHRRPGRLARLYWAGLRGKV